MLPSHDTNTIHPPIPCSSPICKYSLNAYSGHPATRFSLSVASSVPKYCPCISAYASGNPPRPVPVTGCPAIAFPVTFHINNRPSAESRFRPYSPAKAQPANRITIAKNGTATFLYLLYMAFVFSHPIRSAQYTHPQATTAAIQADRLIPAGKTTKMAPTHTQAK